MLNFVKSIFGFLFGIICRRKKKTIKDDGKFDNDRPIEIISVGQSGNRVSSLLEGAKNGTNVRIA